MTNASLLERIRGNVRNPPAGTVPDVGKLGLGAVPTSISMLNTAWNLLVDNIRAAATRGLPMIEPDTCAGRPALIVGTGSSLNDQAVREQILALVNDGAVVFATKGATAVLREMGVRADYAVSCDGQANQPLKTPPVPGIRHLIASCCHPDLFDHVLTFAATIEVFHSACGAVDQVTWESEETLYATLFPGPVWWAEGGSTVVNRALACAWFKGCSHYHVAGADFGVRSETAPTDEAAYARGSAGFQRDGNVWFGDGGHIDGRTWQTTPGLLRGAIHIAAGVRDGHVTVIGDSLAASLAARPEPLSTFMWEV